MPQGDGDNRIWGLRIPGPLLPARWRGFTRPRFITEVLFVGVGYVLYTLTRNHGIETTHETLARHRAQSLLKFEHSLHIDFELTLNKALDGVGWLAQSANYWYATMHFAVTIGVLLWVYIRHSQEYRAVRSVLYITNYVALLGFWAYALAPPRMLTAHGYIDTVVVHGTWGSWGSSGVDSASNQFAAMPSLHIGWSVWCALALVQLSPRLWVKVLGALYPVVTFLVIVATANHFVLDAVGGLFVLSIGFLCARILYGRPIYSGPPAPTPVARESIAAESANA